MTQPDTTRLPFEPREGVPAVIETPEALAAYAQALEHGTGPLALDAERASGYRYSQRAYLVQLRRAGAGSALVDPIAVPDLSAIQQATQGVEWILHAATQDLACLAEVGLHPSSLFDTELAGRLLGRERVSLAALVESELDEVLEKGHGATDWSVRPLSPAQLRYAVLDVELLLELREALVAALAESGKTEIAAEEFEALVAWTPKDRGPDEWRRTSGIHKVRKPRALAAVRALWIARDAVAQEKDTAPGRLLPDSSIIVAAAALPDSLTALRELGGFHGRGAQRYLRKWWAAIDDARSLPDAELPAPNPPAGGPPPPRVWAERDPEAFARLNAAREALSARAEELQLPVENLATPEAIRRVCWQPPQPATAEAIDAALAVNGLRGWQRRECVPVLVAACHAEVTDG